MKIEFKKQPKKYLESAPISVKNKLLKCIDNLFDDWKHIKKLSGYENRYRYKIEHYRIVFERKSGNEIVIVIIEINTRGNIHY